MSSSEGPKRHIACGCCRRRKLKCDGKRPTCSTCQRLHQVCEYPEIVRKAGPKRGYVRSLECRITQLEKLLSDYCIDTNEKQQDSDNVLSLNLDEPMPPPELANQLTEVFFQTFNVMIPIVDKQRYMSLMEQPPDKQPRPFLQYAIMATAAAIVPRFRRLKTILYSRARKYLHKAENFRRLNGAASVGFVQAICLIAHLECREGLLPQAWISVGKAHRALSMLLLGYIDGASYNEQVVLDNVETAELRRAFWFVFLCDRLGSLATTINGAIDLNEVVTRVPMDDDAFLAGDYSTDTCRLEDLMREPALFSRYPNARLAYFVALCECSYQALELGRFPRKQFFNAPKEWLNEYQKVDACLVALRTHMPVIPPMPTPVEDESDTQAFAIYQEKKWRRISYVLVNVLAQAGMLGICRTGLYGIQAMPVLLPLMFPAKLLQRAMMSMLEILLITRNPHDLSVISAHPLHPICLFVVSVLLLALADYELVALQNFQAPLAYMVETLRQLKEDMPLSVMLTAFLVNAMTPQKDDTVKRVEEVLVARRVNLTLPNFFEKWADKDEFGDDGNELDTGEGSPPFVDENPPSVASSNLSPVGTYGSAGVTPSRGPTSRKPPSIDSPSSVSSVDVNSGISIKTEPILSLDFASALEMSRVLDERELVNEETRQTIETPGDNGYRFGIGAESGQTEESRLNPGRTSGHALDSHQAPSHFADVYHADGSFVGVDTGSFDDPPDILPESIDLTMEDTLFTEHISKGLGGFEEADPHWFDHSPGSYQHVGWQ